MRAAAGGAGRGRDDRSRVRDGSPTCTRGLQWRFANEVNKARFKANRTSISSRLSYTDCHWLVSLRISSPSSRYSLRPCGNSIATGVEIMNTREIQLALQAKGFDPGQIDGVRGRMTIAAVKAFQAANNLVVDGIVGPRTSRGAVRPASRRPNRRHRSPITLPWYAEAWRLIGIDEDVGAGSNRMILKWAEDLDIPYGDDDIPWCGLFVAHCIGSQLTDEALPANPLGARNWGRFGDHVSPAAGRRHGVLAGVHAERQGPCGLLCRRGRDALPCPRRQPVQHGFGDAGQPSSAFIDSRWPKIGRAGDGQAAPRGVGRNADFGHGTVAAGLSSALSRD